MTNSCSDISPDPALYLGHATCFVAIGVPAEKEVIQ
jgi:hypothetical protein